ncbi:hypothetical protein [Pseudoalteromonas sp. OOF1S-7]|uniref:hypothetical protein n=1 Tax=Pseudoalteromonas sp. OOF1S-7 TaxID=2917757 RepID=UPI001EF44E94|nr:hypothetical protein [Pseudoalteromonas sp. OOF1S-7]MCG7537951.1 hypothetical protein [Pseudoalteromonas sp. OOF1S-7]
MNIVKFLVFLLSFDVLACENLETSLNESVYKSVKVLNDKSALISLKIPMVLKGGKYLSTDIDIRDLLYATISGDEIEGFYYIRFTIENKYLDLIKIGLWYEKPACPSRGTYSKHKKLTVFSLNDIKVN